MRVSNSLEPDQARRNVGPDLGPNCLQRLSAKTLADKEIKLKEWLISESLQGSYRQVRVISRTSKRLSYCFQGLKHMKNTGLQVKILLLKCQSPLLKILVLENQCKIMVPLFGAALCRTK